MRQQNSEGSSPQQLALNLEEMGGSLGTPGSSVEAVPPLAEMATLATAAVHPAATESVQEDGVAPVLPASLMEQVVEWENVEQALHKVCSNKGSAGVDGMRVGQLRDYLAAHWPTIRTALLDGSYQPQAIRKVEIPKPDGGVRQLGIPTVVDRLIQQALSQVLVVYYDPCFSPSSYGFRPGKSAHQALAAARAYVAEGREWVVDIDLEKFFDRVNHDILMGLLRKRITDKRVLRLIRRYLQAGILTEGVVVGRTEGTPQGGPLSPLLANILLDRLDKELERRGLRFCRYADDCNIYVRSQRAGERVMASVTGYLERKLKLRVNAGKSAVGRPSERKFLSQQVLGRKQGSHLQIHPGAVMRFKAGIRQLTRRNRNVTLDILLEEVGRLSTGWVAYHRYARCKALLVELDSWVRRRLRCYIWKQWRTWRNRARNLTRLGLPHGRARAIALVGGGPWPCSQTPGVVLCLTKAWFASQGYRSLTDRFLKLQTPRTAVCGPACTVV